MNNDTVEIIPAIMPHDHQELIALAKRVAHVGDWIQIDVMDGKFTDSISWPYANKKDNYFDRMIQEEEGLPFWQEVNYSADLMVVNPYEEAVRWVDVGVARVILHWQTLQTKKGTPKELIEYLKNRGTEVVLAVTGNDNFTDFKELISYVDAVQCMGIEKVGFQGESFYEPVLDMIEEIHEQFPDVLIGVDGAVNEETIIDLYDAGARRFAVGSYLLQYEDGPQDAAKVLYGLLGK